jgi:hypothetical protein
MSTAPSYETKPLTISAKSAHIATMDPYYGLSWEVEESFFGPLEDLRPTWTVEPDVEIMTKIARRELSIPSDSPCTLEFLAQGAFNKVYTIRCNPDTDYIMRVSLPVRPRLKTMSERATIEYVRNHTSIPAPQVLHCNALRDDELGFEWMIQERVVGSALTEHWKDMGWLEKELLVRKVIVYVTQLFRQRFHHLGNTYVTQDLQQLSESDLPNAMLLGANHSTNSNSFSISEIVSIPFFYNDHGLVNIDRGPYKHSWDWLAAQLQLALHDVDNMSDDESSQDEDSEDDESLAVPASQNNKSEDENESLDINSNGDDFNTLVPDSEDDGDDDDSTSDFLSTTSTSSDPNCRKAVQHRMFRLESLLPKLFPSTIPEQYVLNHQDLSANNILLTFSHALSGIIDWECVHTVPLWNACQIPRFLRGPKRTSSPPFEQEFENEWYEKAYYENIEEYEKTQLREFFLQEMCRVCPEWVEVFETSAAKADFEFAVSVVALPDTGVPIDEWLEALEGDEAPFSLREHMGQC